jgi:hypothetical protein
MKAFSVNPLLSELMWYDNMTTIQTVLTIQTGSYALPVILKYDKRQFGLLSEKDTTKNEVYTFIV